MGVVVLDLVDEGDDLVEEGLVVLQGVVQHHCLALLVLPVELIARHVGV